MRSTKGRAPGAGASGPGEPREESLAGLDEADLRRTVERLLAGAWRRPVRVTGLGRRPSPFATLFPAEVLAVSLEGGGGLSLFLKHLGEEQADHPDKQCPGRERRAYEELLADDGLPVVRYYGSRWNGATGRRELFLEYVDDWNLKHHGLEHWFTAARRLAHLHAHFADRARRLAACDFLLRLDADYFRGWASRALAAVAGADAGLAARLGPVVADYGRVVEALTRPPPTLVHNDLSPKNVIAARSSSPARIAFIDWEMAGVGCGLLDLVHLKYGLGGADDRGMCEAYRAELGGAGLLPSGRRELGSLLAACELHKTLYRLARHRAWQVPGERVARWVAEAEQFRARV
jgi:Phosphotransferase enzyme family